MSIVFFIVRALARKGPIAEPPNGPRPAIPGILLQARKTMIPSPLPPVNDFTGVFGTLRTAEAAGGVAEASVGNKTDFNRNDHGEHWVVKGEAGCALHRQSGKGPPAPVDSFSAAW